ncbi:MULTISPECIES: PadR family transcriptional regulator [unclassified Deinococcus]|uniref:PadR family transcriptional regulator n=1 Tax=unclassified Deinococcus TaxID=2623546 RepID=UPI001E3A1430|nr:MULTISPECIES: PadR family transcriptional regulator [unclassified Deinococcus]MCD0157601.1 PadR family transcriptional regulator [Deinococcus sp. 6GRE01]MCD0162279.1 PadR family transcriptional regulator [Deinococcus sp. 6YEL10]
MPRPPNSSPHTKAVLHALQQTYPAHTYGYDLSRSTNLKSGTLYPILQRLHEQGHLDAQWEDSPHPGRPPRHIYRLTQSGLQLARDRHQSSPATRTTGALT